MDQSNIESGAVGSSVISVRRVVKLADVRPNGWNYRQMTPDMFEKTVRSFLLYGYLSPVVVRAVAGGFEIVDGEHRWRAAQDPRVAIDEIDVIECLDAATRMPISDRVAKKLMISLNETHGSARYDLLGAMLADMAIDGAGDLIEDLPMPEREIDALLKMFGAPSAEPDDQVVDVAIPDDDGDGHDSRANYVTVSCSVPADAAKRISALVAAATRELGAVPRDVRMGRALMLWADRYGAEPGSGADTQPESQSKRRANEK